MVEFNVNDYVYVKLTDCGIKELKRQHEEMRQYYPSIKEEFSPPETDAEGYSKWQLHDLMNRFGSVMSIGFDVPFETTIKLNLNGNRNR